MIIRAAHARDLPACLALDDSYESEYVWQMETTRANGAIQIGFRTTRLPRPMRATASGSRQKIAEHFELGECLLVAVDVSRVYGFVDLTRDRTLGIGWLYEMTVAPDVRRRGIGSDLLEAAVDWAGQQGLKTIMAAVSTKNYPGTALLQKHGFSFCGYNDRYYPNRDIALFFAYTVR